MRTIEDFIELSTQDIQESISIECAIDLEIDANKYAAYEVIVGSRELTFYFEEGYASYDVNNISGNDTIVLNDYELDNEDDNESLVKSILLTYYNEPPEKLIKELAAHVGSDTCSECGCNEFLCGHNRRS